jgi:hypothetical protein
LASSDADAGVVVDVDPVVVVVVADSGVLFKVSEERPVHVVVSPRRTGSFATAAIARFFVPLGVRLIQRGS